MTPEENSLYFGAVGKLGQFPLRLSFRLWFSGNGSAVTFYKWLVFALLSVANYSIVCLVTGAPPDFWTKFVL